MFQGWAWWGRKNMGFEGLKTCVSAPALTHPGHLPLGYRDGCPQFPPLGVRGGMSSWAHCCVNHLPRDSEGQMVSLLIQAGPGCGLSVTWHVVPSVGEWPGAASGWSPSFSVSWRPLGLRGTWQCSFIHQILQTYLLQGTVLWLRPGSCPQGAHRLGVRGTHKAHSDIGCHWPCVTLWL